MSRDLGMIALHPQYWEMYKDGSKWWELRKVGYSPQSVDTLIIYATAPVSRIVGEVDFVSTHVGYVDDVWDVVKGGCGITREQYDRYYRGHDVAKAYRLGNIWEYITPIKSPWRIQGYRYLSLEDYWLIRDNNNDSLLVHIAR